MFISIAKCSSRLFILAACLLLAPAAMAQSGGGSGGGAGGGSGGGSGSGATTSTAEKLVDTVSALSGRKAIGNIPGLSQTVHGKPKTTVEFILDEQSERLRLRSFQRRYWANVSYQNQINKREDETDIVGLSFGTHIKLDKQHVVGALVLFDTLDTAFDDGRADTRGYFVGAYIAGDQRKSKLSYDLAVLVGEATNSISPEGTFTDDVTSDRVIMTGNLSRKIDRGKMRFTPSLNLKYAKEDWPEYTDQSSETYDARTYEFFETRAKLKAEYFVGRKSSGGKFETSLSLTALETLEPVADSSVYGTFEIGFSAPISKKADVRFTLKDDRIGEDVSFDAMAQVRVIMRF